MLRVILADDEQYERNYLEKVIKESYPGLLEIVYKAVDGMDLMEKLEECKPQLRATLAALQEQKKHLAGNIYFKD